MKEMPQLNQSACATLAALARICGKGAKAGIYPDVYAISYAQLQLTEAGIDVFEQDPITGIITAIGANGAAPGLDADGNDVYFVKIGTVINQGSIKEDYKQSDNGTFDITKALAVSLLNLGSAQAKLAVEAMFGNPMVVLVKLNAGSWVVFGLNGQFQLTTVAGAVDASSNNRVITIGGSDDQLTQIVDPTIVNALFTVPA